jgi:hypothetical protein
VIAKLMMPWMFVSRKSGWTPFAKVRREAEGRRALQPFRRLRAGALRAAGRLADMPFSS